MVPASGHASVAGEGASGPSVLEANNTPECIDCHIKHWRHLHALQAADDPVAHRQFALQLAYCQECHGADLRGGYTSVDCNRCHATWGDDCLFCHSGAGTAFRDPARRTDPSIPTIRAHNTHVEPRAGRISPPLPCSSCHVVPSTLLAPGHADVAPAEVVFTPAGQWNAGPGTCANWCHGASSPAWTAATGSLTCTSCHGTPPSSGRHARHAAQPCSGCHAGADPSRQLVDVPTHVNGTRNVAPSGGTWSGGYCTSPCHSSQVGPLRGAWTSPYHPSGWSCASGDTACQNAPGFHGHMGRYESHGLDGDPPCQRCHGASLGGGVSGVPCNRCHAWPTDNCVFCHG